MYNGIVRIIFCAPVSLLFALLESQRAGFVFAINENRHAPVSPCVVNYCVLVFLILDCLYYHTNMISNILWAVFLNFTPMQFLLYFQFFNDPLSFSSTHWKLAISTLESDVVFDNQFERSTRTLDARNTMNDSWSPILRFVQTHVVNHPLVFRRICLNDQIIHR